MNIDLRQLQPNPFRDFSVDPIDKALVKQLQASIEEDGFWGGIICRKLKDGTIQIGAGHHRVEAAIKAGITHSDVFVSKDMDDDAIVRVYARENATQRGHSSQALLGSVLGAIRRLAQELLGNSGGTIVPPDQQRISQGIGRRQILAKLGHSYEERDVKSALGLLKESGEYDRVIVKVAEKCGVTVPKPVVQEPHVDIRVAQQFPVQSQLDTFRKSVAKLTEEGTLPLKNQLPLAKHLQEKAKKAGREMTSAFIREELNAAVMGVKREERKLNREEQARLVEAGFIAKWKQKETNFKAAVRMLASAALELQELGQKWPKNLAVPISRELRESVRLAKNTIDKLSERL